MERSKHYNHHIWRSPYARLVAIKLGLDTQAEYGQKKKRLTHDEAIRRLADRAGRTVDAFLALDYNNVMRALNCVEHVSYSSWDRTQTKVVVDPIYGRNDRYGYGYGSHGWRY
jgi:hypothetical protein